MNRTREGTKTERATIGWRSKLGDLSIARIHGLIKNEWLFEASERIQSLEGMNFPTGDVRADCRLALYEAAYAQERFEAVIEVNSELE